MSSAVADQVNGLQPMLYWVTKIDFGDQVFDAGEGTPPDGFVGDQCKEALDLIEPGAVGRNEVNLPARPAGDPGPDSRVFVGAVVIDDQMHIQAFGDLGFDLAQEGEKFLVVCRGLHSVSTVP
jgi:hypothetical protein